MICEPAADRRIDLAGQIDHFLGLMIGNYASPFVASLVSLLPEDIQARDQAPRRADGVAEGLNHPVVMSLACRPITARRQSGRGGLEGGVVCDVELPVGAQGVQPRVDQIALDDAEKLTDLLWSGLVLSQPTELQPVVQAHASSRSRRFWVPGEPL